LREFARWKTKKKRPGWPTAEGQSVRAGTVFEIRNGRLSGPFARSGSGSSGVMRCDENTTGYLEGLDAVSGRHQGPKEAVGGELDVPKIRARLLVLGERHGIGFMEGGRTQMTLWPGDWRTRLSRSIRDEGVIILVISTSLAISGGNFTVRGIGPAGVSRRHRCREM